MTGGGFAPLSGVNGTIFSAPIHLGTTAANAAGIVHWAFVVPRGLPVGAHHVVLAGIEPDGNPHLTVYDFTVVGSGEDETPTTGGPEAQGVTTTLAPNGTGSGPLPFTGSNSGRSIPIGLGLLALGFLCVVAARRRFDSSAS